MRVCAPVCVCVRAPVCVCVRVPVCVCARLYACVRVHVAGRPPELRMIVSLSGSQTVTRHLARWLRPWPGRSLLHEACGLCPVEANDLGQTEGAVDPSCMGCTRHQGGAGTREPSWRVHIPGSQRGTCLLTVLWTWPSSLV